jgi:hypothetical protein
MKKISMAEAFRFVIPFIFLTPFLFSQTGFLAPSLLPAGRYESYYPSGKAEGYPPGINNVSDDGTGWYEVQEDALNGRYYREEYTWTIEGDMLILNNRACGMVNRSGDAIPEPQESYIQYFQIMESGPDTIRMRQIKDVFLNGREEYYESDELYVWKRLEE